MIIKKHPSKKGNVYRPDPFDPLAYHFYPKGQRTGREPRKIKKHPLTYGHSKKLKYFKYKLMYAGGISPQWTEHTQNEYKKWLTKAR